MKDNAERRARALRTYKIMGWGENSIVKQIDEELWEILTDVMFGDIWSRPGLSLRDRELVTLGVLIADKAEGMKLHMRNAHHLGITADEIREVVFQVMYYAGQSKGLYAMRRLKEVMAEPESKLKFKRAASKTPLAKTPAAKKSATKKSAAKKK